MQKSYPNWLINSISILAIIISLISIRGCNNTNATAMLEPETITVTEYRDVHHKADTVVQIKWKTVATVIEVPVVMLQPTETTDTTNTYTGCVAQDSFEIDYTVRVQDNELVGLELSPKYSYAESSTLYRDSTTIYINKEVVIERNAPDKWTADILMSAGYNSGAKLPSLGAGLMVKPPGRTSIFVKYNNQLIQVGIAYRIIK